MNKKEILKELQEQLQRKEQECEKLKISLRLCRNRVCENCNLDIRCSECIIFDIAD